MSPTMHDRCDSFPEIISLVIYRIALLTTRRALGEDLRSADVILTPCDLYTTFCCGQDQAARNCCDTSNGTVRIPAGSAILPTSTVTVSDTRSTSSPTDCPSTTMSTAPTINCQPQQKAIIGVGAALGSATLLAVLLSGWFYDQRRKADRRSRLAEQRYQDLVRQRATFE